MYGNKKTRQKYICEHNGHNHFFNKWFQILSFFGHLYVFPKTQYK
jgi:hypothetical protein